MTPGSTWRAAVAGLALTGLLLTACSSEDTPSPSSPASVSSTSPAPSSATGESGTATGSGSAEAPSVGSTAPSATFNTELPSAPAPATTEVPAPGGGNVTETVQTTARTSTSASITATAEYGNGVTVDIAGIEKVTTTAELPGEIAGPGVKVTLQIVNDSASAIDLGNVIVDLQDSAGTPALPMSASPAAPFTGSLAAGDTATGVYVFTVPDTYTNPVTVAVSYSTEVPVVVFVGDAL